MNTVLLYYSTTVARLSANAMAPPGKCSCSYTVNCQSSQRASHISVKAFYGPRVSITGELDGAEVLTAYRTCQSDPDVADKDMCRSEAHAELAAGTGEAEAFFL